MLMLLGLSALNATFSLLQLIRVLWSHSLRQTPYSYPTSKFNSSVKFLLFVLSFLLSFLHFSPMFLNAIFL